MSGTPFGVRETHGILWRPTNEVRRCSDRAGWSSVYASEQVEHRYEDGFGAVPDHLVILHLNGPVGVSRTLGTSAVRRVIPSGGLFILPGGMDFRVRLEATLLSLHVYVRDAVLREVAGELGRGDPDLVEIVPKLGDQDPLLERLALSVREALADPGAAAVYVDYIARLFAARLLRDHAARPALDASARPDGGLTRRQAARAIEYMHAHLPESVTLDDIARAAGLSQSHFARRFKTSLGEPPHRHLLRLRLARAETLLRSSELPLAQIALDCGFSHQGHLTRLFKRSHGRPPAAYRDATRS